MTSASSGVGSNIGGPTIPLQRDLEMTAWTEVNKAALGITKDSVSQNVSFVETHPRYVPGYLGGFGYNATPARTLLDHPLEIIRSAISSREETSGSVEPFYRNLLKYLPEYLRNQLIGQKALPLDERNPNFIAMDNVFTAAAKILKRLEAGTQLPPVPDHRKDIRTPINLFLIESLLLNGNELIRGIRSSLNQMGANFPRFDDVSRTIASLEKSLRLLEMVCDLSRTPSTDTVDAVMRNLLIEAAGQLATLDDSLSNVGLGSDFFILETFVKTGTLVTTAIALPDAGSSPLYISLNLAMAGLNAEAKSKSGGIVGPSFSSILETLSSAIIATVIPSKEIAGGKLLGSLIKMCIFLFVCLSSLIMSQGLGLLPKTGREEVGDIKNFTFEIAIQMLAGSAFLNEIYKECIAASGGDDKAQELGSSILADLTYLFIISAGTQGKSSFAAGLIENIMESLKQGLDSADAISELRDHKGASAVAIKQALIALKALDGKAFLDITNGFLENVGSSIDLLNLDITSLGKQIKSLVEMMMAMNDDQLVTGTVNIV